ncbi:hypothetical protein Tco_1318903 [Tanacetum coccineum]
MDATALTIAKSVMICNTLRGLDKRNVAELKNIKWELPAEFLTLPSQVCHHGGTASGVPSVNVPSAGKANYFPAEGEKNTKDAETNLKDELVDLLGKNVVTQYYTKKLLC